MARSGSGCGSLAGVTRVGKGGDSRNVSEFVIFSCVSSYLEWGGVG